MYDETKSYPDFYTHVIGAFQYIEVVDVKLLTSCERLFSNFEFSRRQIACSYKKTYFTETRARNPAVLVGDSGHR